MKDRLAARDDALRDGPPRGQTKRPSLLRSTDAKGPHDGVGGPVRGASKSRATEEASATSKLRLTLYVTGQSPRSVRAIENLQRICEEDLRGMYEMNVVDVLAQPQLAEDQKILATPTLVKELPPPLRRVMGDLSDFERVLLGLDLSLLSLEDELERGS